MWIKEAVEWTLLREGPLNRRDLVSQIYAFPFLSSTPTGVNEVEARVGDITRFDSSKFRYSHDLDSWSLLEVESVPASAEANQIPNRAPEVHGCGPESVYLIYSPIERYEAVRSHRSQKYRVKIGKTRRSINERLRELQTGNPEVLRVGLEFKTENSSALESFLHSELRNSRISETGNSREWFYSNFEQVFNLYKEFHSQ